MDVEIPKEMSQFGEPMLFCNGLHRAAEWRKTDQWMEGEATLHLNRETTGHGLDLRSAIEARSAARVTCAGHGVSDALHSVPSEKQRNRGRNAKRRQSLQRPCNKAPNFGKRKPAHLVLRCNAGRHGEDPEQGRRSDPSRSGEKPQEMPA